MVSWLTSTVTRTDGTMTCLVTNGLGSPKYHFWLSQVKICFFVCSKMWFWLSTELFCSKKKQMVSIVLVIYKHNGHHSSGKQKRGLSCCLCQDSISFQSTILQFPPSVIMLAFYLFTQQPRGGNRQQENVIRGRKAKMTVITLNITASCQRDRVNLESNEPAVPARC